MTDKYKKGIAMTDKNALGGASIGTVMDPELRP